MLTELAAAAREFNEDAVTGTLTMTLHDGTTCSVSGGTRRSRYRDALSVVRGRLAAKR